MCAFVYACVCIHLKNFTPTWVNDFIRYCPVSLRYAHLKIMSDPFFHRIGEIAASLRLRSGGVKEGGRRCAVK